MDERSDHPGPAEPVARRPVEPSPPPVPAWPVAPTDGAVVRASTAAATTPRRRRLVRSPRGAAGLAILAAALLLWPFAGWSAIPWLIGLAVLVVLRLLRLDGLLRGWVLHLGGIVVVIGLMADTGPWAWALAASIGVLLAGLVLLPRWRVAAVGAVLCLVAGVGFGLSQYTTARQAAEAEAQRQEQVQGKEGAARPQGVLPVLLNRIAQDIPGPVCDNLLTVPARSAFVESTGQPDCAAAVASLAARVVDRAAYSRAEASSVPRVDGIDVDACLLSWPDGSRAGPPLGHLTISRKAQGSTYAVTAFTPC